MPDAPKGQRVVCGEWWIVWGVCPKTRMSLY